MATTRAAVGKALRRVREELRRRRLEAGEAGWGHPVPVPPRVPLLSASRAYRVAVIGAGGQGLAQCQGMRAVTGIDIVGVADRDEVRLHSTAARMSIPPSACFTSASDMLRQVGPLDLVCIATTAPSHVQLGRLALESGAKRILLEKPMDTSLRNARQFTTDCVGAGVSLSVNHSRRWMLEYRAIKRCIDRQVIGAPRSISILVGKGELANHGSHYFDLCRYFLGSEPERVVSYLEAPAGVNSRGAQFQDPHGHCLFTFANGSRAYLDFSSDLLTKNPFIAIKGTLGLITIDEAHGSWTLQSLSQRTWTFRFAESFKASTIFSRVAVGVLSDEAPASSGADGVAALEMLAAAHLSHRGDHHAVTFPVSNEEADDIPVFP